MTFKIGFSAEEKKENPVGEVSGYLLQPTTARQHIFV